MTTIVTTPLLPTPSQPPSTFVAKCQHSGSSHNSFNTHDGRGRFRGGCRTTTTTTKTTTTQVLVTVALMGIAMAIENNLRVLLILLSSYVCRLHKSLYGLKQAPRVWYNRLSGYLLSIGYYASMVDTSLFI